jgi:hypothetical protein
MSPMAMAADEDKKDDESTRVGAVPPRPPQLGAPPAPPAAPAPVPASAGEETRLGKIPVPPPPLRPPPTAAGAKAAPAAAPPKAESPTTSVAAAPPPPAPKQAPPAASAAPPAAAEPAAAEPAAAPAPPVGDDLSTILLPSSQRVAARLQRTKPAGRSEVVPLQHGQYLLGRGRTADIRLYSETASREHARLLYRDARWYLEPMRGKVVVVDGANVREEIALGSKTHLQFGGDEVLFLDEGGDDTQVSARAGARGVPSRAWTIVLIAAGLLVVALWLFMGR